MHWVGFYIPSWPRCSFITDPKSIIAHTRLLLQRYSNCWSDIVLFCNIKHTPYGRTFQIKDANTSRNVIYVECDVGVTTFLCGCSENLLDLSLIYVLWIIDDTLCSYGGGREINFSYNRKNKAESKSWFSGGHTNVPVEHTNTNVFIRLTLPLIFFLYSNIATCFGRMTTIIELPTQKVSM